MAPALMESKMQSSGKAMSELEKLRHAVFHAHVDELGRLLADSARDVDLDTKSCLEESLLMLAVRSGIATRREVGLGAMQRGSASSASKLAVVRCLLEARAAVNTCDLAQETPLMEASCAGDVGMCQLLLEFSADPTCRSARGHRAADFVSDGAHSAACSSSAEVTRLLDGAGETGKAQVRSSRTLQEETVAAVNTQADVLVTEDKSTRGGKISSPRTSASFFDFDELGDAEPKPRTSASFFDFDELGEAEPEPRDTWKKASVEEMEKLDNSEEEAESTSSSQDDSSEEASEESADEESVPVPLTKVKANLGSGRDEPELVGFQYTFDKGQVQQPAEQTRLNMDLSALPVEVQKLRRQCAKMGLSVEWCIDREVMQDLLQKVHNIQGWGVCSLISECTNLGLPNPSYIGREEIMHRICTALVWHKLPLNLLESEAGRRRCQPLYFNQTTKDQKRKECLRRLIADAFPDAAAQQMGGFGFASHPLQSGISAMPASQTRAHKPAWTGTPVTREPTHWEVYRASLAKSSSSESSDSDEEAQKLKKLHPRVKNALQQCSGFTGKMPGKEAESWTDKELTIYFQSNGEILPARGTKESKHPAPKKVEKAKPKEDRRGAPTKLSGIPQVQTAADIAGAAAMKEAAEVARLAEREAEIQALREANAKAARSLNQPPASPPQRPAPVAPRPKMVGRQPKFGAGRPQPKMYPGNLFSHRVKASVPGQPRPAAEPLPKYSPPKAPPSRLPLADEHYETLSLPATASIEDVRKAYKRLAFQYHPDKNTGHNDGSMFKKISAAYEAISQHLKG